MAKKESVDIISQGDLAVVAFKATSISNLKGIGAASKQINKFLEQEHPVKIIFDFSGVKFFSSQVLGLLLDIRARLKLCDGEVVISGIDPQVHRVFKITSLDKIFRFFSDRESAVEQINAG